MLLQRILGPHRFQTHSPWGVWAGLSAVVGVGVLSIAVAFGVILVGSAIVPEWSAKFYSCAVHAPAGLQDDCGLWLLGLSGFWGILLAGAFYGLSLTKANGNPQNVLLLRGSGLSWWQYAVVFIAMLATLYLLEVLMSLATGATQADLERGLDHLKAMAEQGGVVQWAMLIAVVAVIAPVSEEFVFRGFMFTTLIKTPLGFVGAAALTSAAWTLLHYAYTWQILVVLFFFGVLLAYVVWRTGSIWTGIVVHGLNNLVSAVVLAFR